MSREIVLDTETTGLDPEDGHRIVEIGCLELINHVPTGKSFQVYINPKRDMDEGAQRVTGLTLEFLQDKPLFEEVVQDFIDFIGDDKLVIHNAAFDIKFINAEFARLNIPPLPMTRAIDTLHIARRKFPGSPASLDALCKRFGVDHLDRTFHGALLDSELLADVYLELIGGRQPDLVSGGTQSSDDSDGDNDDGGLRHKKQAARPTPLPSRVSAEEAAAHLTFIKEELGDDALWIKK